VIVLAIGPLFGAERLPQTARNLGQGIREVRHALHQGSQSNNCHATQEPSAGRSGER
jgi:Sec-independent protein translocase protein TatA